MKQVGSDEARRTFRDLLDDANRGEATEISRNGKPVAVLMPAGVNVYLLERAGDIGYDEAAGFVVAASTEADAREQAAERAGNEGGDTWLMPSLSTCEAIGPARQSGVILRSFRAG